MNTHSDGIVATKPKSVFKKNMKFDLKPIFKGLTKAVMHAGSGTYIQIPGDAAEILAGLGFENHLGDSAYLLIKRALFSAAFDLANESLNHFDNLRTEAEPRLSASLETRLSNLTITLTTKFLSSPKSLPILKDITSIFEQWLIDMGTSPKSAHLIARRYDSYFVYALSAEWRNNQSAYKDLIDSLHTPFGAAEERERDWENYFAMLDRRINENIFDEPFSLAQIYVPLNAYYSEKVENDGTDKLSFGAQRKRYVVSLENDLLAWVIRRPKEDALRVVSGGPGSGKSSFMKMLCATLCTRRIAKPVYIPLHLIDPTRDVAEEVGKFVRDEGFLRFNPLDVDTRTEDLVLIFDGLDELASQGKVAAQVAKDFVQAVERMVERRNLGPNPILVLISGRELVVQENATEFRRDKQILNILPYFIPNTERREYLDPGHLLDVDLRHDWWKNYGMLTEKNLSGVPQSLQKHDIDEITAQPLLNYLVALSFSRGKLDFEKSLNLNNVYADLVTAVYERGYEKNRIHRSISHIHQKDFVRVLEEIGLAAWHGSDGRSTSVNEILNHCKESGLESLITTFQEGAKAGVTKLLAAFFFRQNGQQASGDATFVFTHKSFGEYLTAVRIVRGIERIVVQLQRRLENPDDGYDITEGLVRWISLAGPAQMTTYIKKFLMREIRTYQVNTLHQWKNSLSDLLSQAIERHMPMDKVGVLTFAEAYRQNNNACESLVISLNACAVALREPIKVRLADSATFGTFLRRITPQRTGPKSPLLFSSLSYFDFSGQSFDLADLYGANLSHTNLQNATMHYANFSQASLNGANLQGAIMVEVDLSGAQLNDANLTEARITAAKLKDSSFTRSVLRKADISFSDVHDANFSGADVTDLRAAEVNFDEARNFVLGAVKAKLEPVASIGIRRPPMRPRTKANKGSNGGNS